MEDRYEAFEVIIRARSDGQSWFDLVADLLSSDCEATGDTCTCGLESMGGTTGTLDQCYRAQGIADDLVGPVNTSDLKRILSIAVDFLENEEDDAVYERLRKAAYWHDDFNEWLANLPDDEEDDYDED